MLVAQPNKSSPSSPSPLSYQPCHRRRALTVLPSPRHPRFSLRPPPASLPSSIHLSPTLRAANHAAISQPRRPRCEPPNSSKRQTQAILQPLLPTSSRQPASIQKEQPSRPILLNSLLRSAVLAAAATPASHYTLPSSSPSNTRTRSRPAASRPHSISSHPRVPLLPATPAKSSCCKQSKHYAHTHTRKHTELTPTSGACDPLCSVDETSSLDFEASYKPTTDLLKALAILAASMTGAVAINQSWVAANQDAAMALLFGIGYAGIIFEESLAFNKSGVGLLMAVSLWVVRRIGAPSTEIAVSELTRASAEVGEIVFFLLGAMTIVEIVDAHQGFKLVTDNITTRKPRTLLWVVGFVTFFLSSVLDNLTSTIIMVSLLQKLVPPSEYRKLLGAVVVIAANAGGAWTPIGDITTTMLWVHGQISTLQTMKDLIIPSAVSLAVPLALMSLTSEVNGKRQDSPNVLASEQMAPRGQLVFSVGIGALLFAPVFKAITGLPPYMGMLLGLGVLWLLTDAIHYGESESQKLRVPHALSRIDIQGVLFFLGILLSVSSLEAAGILRELANYLDAHIANSELIASAIGVVSAIIDNVPLAAATMGMYDLSSYPQDSELWQLVAYCVGTGGSMLVIGSAAGVAFMGMEKVDFFWYLRKVSGFAFAGYAAGIATYLAVHNLPISLPTTLARFPFLSS